MKAVPALVITIRGGDATQGAIQEIIDSRDFLEWPEMHENPQVEAT